MNLKVRQIISSGFILMALYASTPLVAQGADSPTTIKIGGIFDLSSAVGSVWGNKYQAAYREPPSAPSASVAYDETLLVLNCAAANPDTAAVATCISSTKDFSGMSGSIAFAGRQTAADRKFELLELK